MPANQLAKSVSYLASTLCIVLVTLGLARAEENKEGSEQPGAEKIDFASQVRPILSDRCYFCHGPDASRREADLRLDTREAAHEYAITPGDAAESEVIRRILSEDPDDVMPPPDSKLSLTASEKEILRQWIDQGAVYEEHWAFKPPKRPSLPNAAGDSRAIDAFVAERLRDQKLKATAPADKATLIRRLSFDLIGLPPTPDEVDAFLDDSSPAAYEKLVDRLLASEKYGERMAVDWLDVARYADTHGYQNDRYRPMWPWRDWVVEAFNKNLPYDKFITWQLAGDLLPDASREQVLATAFNRNHRQTNEGGSVEEEFRAEYVADRVNTFGAAFLGLTLECCRCHDHKYDPISQKEYYQLAAFFNSIDESGLYSHFTDSTPTPALQLYGGDQEKKLLELREQISALESKLAKKKSSLDAQQFDAWRASFRDLRPSGNATGVPEKSLKELIQQSISAKCIGDFSLDGLGEGKVINRVDADKPGKVSDGPIFSDGKVGGAVLLSGDNNVSVPAGGDFTRDQAFSISLWMKSPEKFSRAVILHRSRAWTDSASRGYELLIEDGKLSAALIHFWPGNAMRVRSRAEISVNRWMQVTVTYDGSSKAAGLKLFVDGEEQEVDIVRDKLTRTIDSSPKELALGQRFRDNGFKNGQIDELKVFAAQLTSVEVKYLYLKDESPANLSEFVHNLTQNQLQEFFFQKQPETAELQEELQKLRVTRSGLAESVPEIMVMREDPSPRTTHILMRGAYDAPGDEVTRGFPESLSAGFSSENPGRRANRLDLAKWLVEPKHPLTARVAVNRIWQALFGQGLVRTSEDFGLQGSLPTHPELLDWLAVEFVESGWDVKALVKRIVMSDAYRRQSNPTAELLENDPENTWLARGPAMRLPAEMIRDAALSASGLLVEKLGGPPVKPYQPAGLWKEKSGQTYTREKGEGSRRRSLYTYWKRTSPPPSMMTFDASNREVCVVKRQVTMTPMQVLVLLNDPQYVEAARAMAANAIENDTSSENRIRKLFRALITRVPSERELQVLTSLYDDQLNYFNENAEAATLLLKVGDHRAVAGIAEAELAALSVVAEGLMSYDETVMKR